MAAYYNEFDPFPAAWLRNLAAAGKIASGRVDERSIAEVGPSDIGSGQAHFFAGLGAWSHALRLAGWPDDLPVWTGSCPCQGWSDAGRQKGFDDERHLWPEWFRLIRERRPRAIFGEQVASKSALAWLDALSTDLEGEGYTVGAVDIPACGVGAPHIRNRLWIVALADDDDSGWRKQWRERIRSHRDASRGHDAHGRGQDGGADRGAVADAVLAGRPERRPGSRDRSTPGGGGAGLLGDSGSAGGGRDGRAVLGAEGEGGGVGIESRRVADQPQSPSDPLDPWADCEWVWCTDGKWRPTEPGTFPLSHGSTARVGRLRAYGNAITAPVAARFIEAVTESL